MDRLLRDITTKSFQDYVSKVDIEKLKNIKEELEKLELSNTRGILIEVIESEIINRNVKLHEINQYKVKIDEEYIYIRVKGYTNYYQLKLEGEGLVLDTIQDNGEFSDSLFHCMNQEELEE